MKKITLLSAVLLSGLAINVFQSVAHADDSGTTDGVVGFAIDQVTPVTPQKPEIPGEVPDPGGPLDPNEPIEVIRGSLSLNRLPKEFNFGYNAVDASDLLLTNKKFTQKNYLSAQNDPLSPGNPIDTTKTYSSTRQIVSVWDGRVLNDSWTLTVAASTFTKGTDTLAGATIEIAGVSAYSHALANSTQPQPTDGFLTSTLLDTKANLIIPTSGTGQIDVTKTSTGQKVKNQTDMGWDVDKVSLNVPGNQIKLGGYSSTITWTLAGTPDA